MGRERGNGSSAKLLMASHGSDSAEPCLAVLTQTTVVRSRRGRFFAFNMRNVAVGFLLRCDQWSSRSIVQCDVWLLSQQRVWFGPQQGQSFAFSMSIVPMLLEENILTAQHVHCGAVRCLRAMTLIMPVRYPRGARVLPAELGPARSCARCLHVLPSSICSDTHLIINLNVHVRPDYYHPCCLLTSK